MGQILGLGVTHSPPLLSAAGDTASRIKHMLPIRSYRSATAVRRPGQSPCAGSGATTKARRTPGSTAPSLSSACTGRARSSTPSTRTWSSSSATTSTRTSRRTVSQPSRSTASTPSTRSPGSTPGPVHKPWDEHRRRSSATRATERRQTSRHPPHRAGLRRRLCLQAAPRCHAARYPQHVAVPGLGPAWLRLPGRRRS